MNFDKFKGIEKEREVRVRDKANLENLIEVGKELIKEFKIKYDHHAEQFSYPALFDAVQKRNLQFDESDLKAYIFANVNKDYERTESMILGMYAGCLLETLTERNRAVGKTTRFYINGQGDRFDNLFMGIRFADDLIVDNFKGDGICNTVGGRRDTESLNVNLLAVLNCTGNFIASTASAGDGKVGALILVNNSGHSIGVNAAAYSRVDLLLAVHNWGDSIIYETAHFSTGSADLVIAANNTGDCIASSAAKRGKINSLCILNHTGDYAAGGVAEQDGHAGLVLVANHLAGRAVAGMTSLPAKGETDYSINQLVVYGVKRDDVKNKYAKEIIAGFDEKPRDAYLRISKGLMLPEFIGLAESMKEKGEEELFAITDKIKETYAGLKK